jgi:DNA repair exonuclease SbcCD ATPase subunit
MKYVSFKELKIKNFLSIGEDSVTVNFEKGLHIVTGINRDKEDRRNGVGKSTIADALYFAIFGQTLRDIKKNFIANNLTSGTCEVQLSFTVDDPKHGINEFDIIRTLNPSKVYIYKNGIDKTRDSISNTNEYINTVLSSTPEIFQNCVIMTLNNHIPFMGKSKTEKRKFIEQIFNLEVFSKMLSELRNEHNEVKRNFDIEITRLEETNNHLNTQQQQVDNFEENKNQRISRIQNQINSKNIDLENYKNEKSNVESLDEKPYIERLNELQEKINELDKNKNEVYEKMIQNKTDLNSNKNILEKIGTEEATCPVCLRPLEDHDKDLIDSEKEKLKNITTNIVEIIKEHKAVYEGISEDIKKYNSVKVKIDSKLLSIQNQKNNISYLERNISDIENIIKQYYFDIDDVKKETNSFDELITLSINKINEIKQEIDTLKKVINLMDVVKFVVSEEGVKSFIVKKILSHFNGKLTHFLKKLDSNCVCIFNEYFEEEIVNEKGKICLYNNFSGAERKAIDLACLFSFMDMRKSQGDVYYNISFYDELFDSSLDEKGVDLVLEILNERVEKYNECVMVISHRKESIKSANGDVIFLEKHNGITRRVNFVD